MNRKLLIGGSCLVLGISLLLAHRLKERPAALSADGSPGAAARNHPPVRLRSPGDDRRTNLIEQLNAIVKSGGPIDRERLSSLLVQLVGIDPTAAELWAAGLSDASERQSALEDVCLQFAQENAKEAVRAAEQYQLGTHSGRLMENLAHQWAVQDLPAAAAWIKAQPAGERREQMVMRLAFVQAATQPAEAARLVVEEIPEGPVQTEAVISVIHQWAGRDLPGARAWVGLFPQSPLRDRAESELANLTTTPSEAPR